VIAFILISRIATQPHSWISRQMHASCLGPHFPRNPPWAGHHPDPAWLLLASSCLAAWLRSLLRLAWWMIQDSGVMPIE